ALRADAPFARVHVRTASVIADLQIRKSAHLCACACACVGPGGSGGHGDASEVFSIGSPKAVQTSHERTAATRVRRDERPRRRADVPPSRHDTCRACSRAGLGHPSYVLPALRQWAARDRHVPAVSASQAAQYCRLRLTIIGSPGSLLLILDVEGTGKEDRR